MLQSRYCGCVLFVNRRLCRIIIPLHDLTILNEPRLALIAPKMAYFLPSFFQKRLLRYALSRLEVVDTEALDLDSLGIRWGQRSTVELRDIGLRLEVSVCLKGSLPGALLMHLFILFFRN